MKIKFLFFMLAIAAFCVSETAADAQALKNLLKKAATEVVAETAANETVTASANGQAAGAALKALYTQYKSDGKLDTGNLTNILNLTTLATNVKGLKGMTDKTTFYKDFASGLIAGSGNLVTQNNSAAVMSGLTSLVNNVDLSALTDKAAGAQLQASALQGKSTETAQGLSSIKDSVSGILGLLK